MCQSEQGRRAGAGVLTFGAASIARRIAATLAEEGLRSLMLSAGLAQLCSPARLAVRTLLDAFRLLLPDVENLSGNDARAQIFKVRQQDSKGIEHSVYRSQVGRVSRAARGRRTASSCGILLRPNWLRCPRW